MWIYDKTCSTKILPYPGIYIEHTILKKDSLDKKLKYSSFVNNENFSFLCIKLFYWKEISCKSDKRCKRHNVLYNILWNKHNLW